MIRGNILSACLDDARLPRLRMSEQYPEIKIVGEHNRPIVACPLHNFRIGGIRLPDE